MFEWLARELIDKGTTQGIVRSVVTGSTAELKYHMESLSVSGGERVQCYLRNDPTEDAVVKALVARVGYSEEDARRIVDKCGPRMRPLQGQLKSRIKEAADDVIQKRMDNAHLQFDSFFKMIARLPDSRSNTLTAIQILDKIESAETGGWGVWPLLWKVPERPTWKGVPDALIATDFSRLIFVGPDGRLFFQSRVHRTIWRGYRHTAVSGAPA